MLFGSALSLETILPGLAVVGIALVIKWLSPKVWSRTNGQSVLMTMSVLFLAMFVSTIGYRVHNSNRFDAKYADYIKAAYNAKDYATARKYLERAVKWFAENDVKNGPEQTAVLYEAPDHNVHDWCAKAIQCMSYLDDYRVNGNIDWKATMKNFGLVVQKDDKGNIDVIFPPGISVYPYNAESFALQYGSLALTVVFGGGAFGAHLRRREPREAKAAQGETAGKSACTYCGNAMKT